MEIKPLPGIIQLGIKEPSAGVLDTSSKQAAVEYAEVLETGPDIRSLRIGDHVFVKSWAIDIIQHEDKKYYFVNSDSKGILAVVK